MKRIRQGNDFLFLWTIVRNGIPEDLDNAKNIKLHFKNFDCIGEVTNFQIVDGNIVRVEVAPEWASTLGAYRLILSYEFENSSYSDGDRKCVVDVLAFNIVPKTSEADDLTEITETTDIMIGFYGLSAYEVWLKDNPESTKEDYYNWLRQPATDAVSLIDDKIEHLDEVIDTSTANEAERVTAETLRLQSENLRISAETERKANEVERLANESSRVSDELIREANESTREQDEARRKTNENERETAELTRQSSESERVEAEGSRVNAEIVREQQEQARQANTATAITNAENAITDVNAAKDDYYDVVKPDIIAQGEYAQAQGDYAKAQGEAIQDDLALKANHGYDSSPKSLKQVDGEKAEHGYASIEVAKTLKQVEDDTSVKMTNLVVNGGFESGVPSWFGARPVLSEEEKLSGDSSGYANVNGISYSIIDIACDLNDKLYFSVSRRFKSIEGTTASTIRITDFGALTGSAVIGPFYNGNLDVWETTTFIADGRTNGVRLAVGFFSISPVQYFVDNFIAVNLTETFGKGSEPTQEEFELLLDILGIDFFEGEITIPSQKLMQWQLTMIRQNRNAIIALGGTII